MATTALCSITDVQNRLSSTGVTLRTDDTPPTTYGDIIDEASTEVEGYCLGLYSSENLATSDFIRHLCADIATELLCMRRGNAVPAVFLEKADRARMILEKIRKGVRYIPDIGAREASVPVMSNLRVVQRPHPRAVVERSRSTGKVTTYRQHRDRADENGYDYSI